MGGSLPQTPPQGEEESLAGLPPTNLDEKRAVASRVNQHEKKKVLE